jgi:hypothetical protein
MNYTDNTTPSITGSQAVESVVGRTSQSVLRVNCLARRPPNLAVWLTGDAKWYDGLCLQDSGGPGNKPSDGTVYADLVKVAGSVPK